MGQVDSFKVAFQALVPFRGSGGGRTEEGRGRNRKEVKRGRREEERGEGREEKGGRGRSLSNSLWQ